MPIADYPTYCKMLDNAKANKFAFPAINVSSTETANAALKGFADKKSDGIIQVSTGGGEFASGLNVKNAVIGAISLADHIIRMAAEYDVVIALHTDHCMPSKVDSFLIPLSGTINLFDAPCHVLASADQFAMKQALFSRSFDAPEQTLMVA